MKNKLTAAVSAFSIAAAMACGTAFAAGSYTKADLVRLNEVVLGAQETAVSDDINADGSVDALDLCAMRKTFLSTGEYAEYDYMAVAENVKLMGRTYNASGTTWLVQSGSAAEFTLTGKSAEITLAGDSSINNGVDYASRYAVYVDGELLIDETLLEEEKTITLFEGETSRTAEIKVIHLSEAANGAVGVKNIHVVSDSAVPIQPAAQKDLCIEFIGDSITCAYGVEGASQYENFKTTTENFMKSYAYLTAQKLDADYSAVCYSGHGIVSGYTNDGEKNTVSLVQNYYDYVGRTDEHLEEWDFSARSNDVVVINLGTNDDTYVSKDFETRSLEFIEEYEKFLTTVREKNPEAYIICTVGTMGCEEIYPLIAQAVENFKAETGEERVMSYQSATQDMTKPLGSDWHPSAETQQNSAYVLADKICQALGMESDQIGLDVAADAVYDTVIDSASGANAAFYVGYDKSFWINMVTGGDSPEDIEAVLSGIGLKAGGKYRLEFDYTVSVDKTIPVILRGSAGEVYYSDEIEAVNASSEKQHYSAEFTVSSADEAASLVYQIGGQDSYNVTLSSIKLVKIA